MYKTLSGKKQLLQTKSVALISFTHKNIEHLLFLHDPQSNIYYAKHNLNNKKILFFQTQKKYLYYEVIIFIRLDINISLMSNLYF